MSNKQEGQNFLQGTAILAMATALVKIMGAVYKIPLNAIIGEQGFGYFNTAYEIYNVLLMISTAGLPVAMSQHDLPGQFSGKLQSGPPHLRRSQKYFFDLRYRRQRAHDGLLPPTGPISEPAGCLGRHRLSGALCAADLHHFHLPGLLPGTG